MALNQMAQFVQQDQRACGPRARPKGADVGWKLTWQIFAPLVKSTIDVYDAIIKETVRRVRWPIVGLFRAVDRGLHLKHLAGPIDRSRKAHRETVDAPDREAWV